MSFVTREDLDRLLNVAIEQKVSDIHLGVDRPPYMRKNGLLRPVPGYEYRALSVADMEMLIELSAKTPTAPSTISEGRDLDYIYEPARTHGKGGEVVLARFRVNACNTTLGGRLVFRRLPAMPPTVEEIDAPAECTETVRNQRQGLILVTGPTGSGKSTTLAAWIRLLLESDYSLHILTLENPVEFRYDDITPEGAFITQRELGRSMIDFETGMRSGLRQDPDVVLVGEMRDQETMRLALEAAETGHLVFGTVHTTDVPSTISRIVQTYPPIEQASVRVQLLSSLRMIVCQRLLPSPVRGRVAAREYLTFQPHDRKRLITQDPGSVLNDIKHLVETAGVSMGQSVAALRKAELIEDSTYEAFMKVLQEEAITSGGSV